MNRNVLHLVIGALVVATAPTAAQSMTGDQACSNDAYRLCERFIPDRGKTGSCLQRNKRLLSPECRVLFSGHKLRRH
jgi:hypothetical protein